jgi:hypothetical protein
MRAWLVGKNESAQSKLTDGLCTNGYETLARLVNRTEYEGILDLYLSAYTKQNDSVYTNTIDKQSISIILPWSDDFEDLEQRIESIQNSNQSVDEVLVIVPNPSIEKLARTRLAGVNITITCMFDGLGQQLVKSRAMAKGEIIGYLFPYHRFDPDFLGSGTKIIASGKYSLVFANRVDLYPDVTMEGNQLYDALIPFPKDRETVLGQEGRKPLGYLQSECIYLSGFLHSKEGNWDLLLPLNETVPEYDWVLAMDWAYRVPFSVLPTCNMRIRKKYHFEDRLWKAFLRATVQPYLESAFGLLYDVTIWKFNSEAGKTLDALWRNDYPINSRNRHKIFSAYVINVPAPWRYSVFRMLCAWQFKRNFASALELGGVQGGVRTLIAWILSFASRAYGKI